MHVFTEVDVRGQEKSMQRLAAAMVGAPRFSKYPTVVVALDEQGVEQARAAYHASDELQDYVDAQLLQIRKTT